MTQPEIVATELQLIISRYLQNAKQASGAAREVDQALKDIVQSAEKAAKAMNGLSGGKLKIDVDTSKLASAKTDIRALDSLDPEIVIIVDDGELASTETKIKGLADDIGIKLDVQADTGKAKNEIDALDNDTLKPKVDADTDKAKNEINALDGQRIEVEVDGNVSKLRASLNSVVTGALERLGGRATDAALSIDPLAAAQDSAAAGRTFAARTGQEIESVGAIIDSVFVQGLSDSRVQVAEVAAQLSNLGVSTQDLENATLSVFQAATATGEDASEVIRAQAALVKNDLVGSYQEAADVVTVGFQSGANRAGDLIDTFAEYSPVFKSLGIDGAGALELINQALDQGAFNSDKLGDAFKEMNLLVTEAVNTGEGGAADALKRLGLFDEAEALKAGELTGVQFADAVVKAVEEKGTNTDLVSIFGTPVEDLGFDIFKNLDFEAALTSAVSGGTAESAADAMTDTLGARLTELGRTIQMELGENFKLAGLSLNELLDQAKDKIGEIADLIQDGKTIPEALEIALEAPGLAEKIDEFSGAIGNFIIEFQLGLASVLDFLGKGEAASAVRAGAAAQSVGQFGFDIKNADNAQDVLDLVNTARRRGVGDEDLVSAMNNALKEMVDSGNLAQVEEVMAGIKAAEGTSVELTVKVAGVSQSQNLMVDPALAGQGDDAIRAAAEAQARAALGPLYQVGAGAVNRTTFDIGEAEQYLDDATVSVEELGAAIGKLGTLAVMTDAEGNKSLGFPALQTQVDETGKFVGKFVDQTVLDFGEVGRVIQEQGDESVTALDLMSAAVKDTGAESAILGLVGVTGLSVFATQAVIEAGKVQAAWEEAAAAINAATPSTMGSGTPENGFYTGGVGIGTFMAGENGREIVSSNTALAVLNNRTTETLLSGLAALLSGGGMGGGGKSTQINIYNTFNTASMAQASGAGASLAARVRGF